MSQAGTCSKCGKQLVSVNCRMCDGKGWMRERLFSKTPCRHCGATGQIYECPDRFQHQMDELRARYNPPKITFSSLSGGKPNQLRSQPVRCPTCGGAGGIMFRGQAGPCPTCGGRGTISR